MPDITLKWLSLKAKMYSDIKRLNCQHYIPVGINPTKPLAEEMGEVNMHNWIVAYIRKLETVLNIQKYYDDVSRSYEQYSKSLLPQQEDSTSRSPRALSIDSKRKTCLDYFKISKRAGGGVSSQNVQNIFKIRKDSADSEDSQESYERPRKKRRKYKKRKRTKDRSELPDATGQEAIKNTIEFLYSKYMLRFDNSEIPPNNALPIFKMRKNKNKNIWKIKRRDKKREVRRSEREAELESKREKDEIARRKAAKREAERKRRGYRLFVKKN